MKKIVFITVIDIIGLISFIASCFLNKPMKTYIILAILLMTFLAFHIVSIWLVNNILDNNKED